eukprot:SM000011S19063  [mRNA]  locus=s11:606314:609018:- [translate_table: standard]
MFDDPFDYGEDEDLAYGDLLADGQQGAQEPRPPNDPDSAFGSLLFPKMYQPEIASLGLYIRGDVRRCVCLVAGGVYENLLFFPIVQLLKNKYPGVRIDVVANARSKQTHELNKNVRRAWTYELEDPFVVPVDYTEFLGKLKVCVHSLTADLDGACGIHRRFAIAAVILIKNECYDLVLSTKQAGMGHAVFLWMTDARQRVSYVIPNVNGAGAGAFLSAAIRAPHVNLAEGGYHMYADLEEFLCKPQRDVPQLDVPPLQVGISRKVRQVALEKREAAGLEPGVPYVLFHGIQSTSAASMQSAGDPDSLLPLSVWAELARVPSAKVLVVVPNDKETPKVLDALGQGVHPVKITTPGQLAAAIDDSIGVATTNTAAVQLAMALNKPGVAFFSSAEKAAVFAPHAKAKGMAIVASSAGGLAGLDVQAAAAALAEAFPSSAPPTPPPPPPPSEHKEDDVQAESPVYV